MYNIVGTDIGIALKDALEKRIEEVFVGKALEIGDVGTVGSVSWHSMVFLCDDLKSAGECFHSCLQHYESAMPFWTTTYNNSFLCDCDNPLVELKESHERIREGLRKVLSKFEYSYMLQTNGFDLSGVTRCMEDCNNSILNTIDKAIEEDKAIAASEERCLEQKRAWDARAKGSGYYHGVVEAHECVVNHFTDLKSLKALLKDYSDRLQTTKTWKLVNGGALAAGDGFVAKMLRHRVSPDDYLKYFSFSRLLEKVSEMIDAKKSRLSGVKVKSRWLLPEYDNDGFRELLFIPMRELRMNGDLTDYHRAFIFYRECNKRGYTYGPDVFSKSAFISDMKKYGLNVTADFSRMMKVIADSGGGIYNLPDEKVAGKYAEAFCKISKANGVERDLVRALDNAIRVQNVASA